jgi:hypothetical protein
MDAYIEEKLEEAFKIRENVDKYDALLLELKEAILDLNVWKDDDVAKTINSPKIHRISEAEWDCKKFLDKLVGAVDAPYKKSAGYFSWYEVRSMQFHTSKIVAEKYMEYYWEWVDKQTESLSDNDIPRVLKYEYGSARQYRNISEVFHEKKIG